MYDVISMPSEVYVIQELAQGGSLLDYIRDRKRVSENLAIRFFLQVVAGLQYCHDREVSSQVSPAAVPDAVEKVFFRLN